MANNKVTTVFTANTKEFDAAVKRSVKNMGVVDEKTKDTTERMKKGFTQGAIAIGAAAFAIIKLTKSASDLEETTAKFNTVFKTTSRDMAKEVNNLTANYAMSTREARGNLAAMQDLLVPMGMGANSAAGMSTKVVKLAADLGSFNNLKSADVMRDISSALVGNFETMKKFGVVLNATNVQQEAMRLGLKRTVKELTAADKAQAAFSLITKGSAAAIGDMARTSDSYANQVKKMNASIEDLTAGVGQAFMPLMKDIVGVISDAAKWFNSLDSSTKELITTVVAVGAAILVLTKVVMAFGVSFKSALGPVALGVTILTAVIALVGAASISIEDYKEKNKKLEASLKAINKELADAQSINIHFAGIKKLKEGSKEYKKKIDDLIKVYPALRSQNVSTGSSYLQMAKAVKEASKQMNAQARVAARKTRVEALNTVRSGFQDLAILQTRMSRSTGDALKALQDKYTVLEATITRSSIAYGKAGEILDKTSVESRNIIAKVGGEVVKVSRLIGITASETDRLTDSMYKVAGAARKATIEAGKLAGIPLVKNIDLKAGNINKVVSKVTKGFNSILDAYKAMIAKMKGETENVNGVILQAQQVNAALVKAGLLKNKELRNIFSTKEIEDMIALNGLKETQEWLSLLTRLAQQKKFNEIKALMNAAADEKERKREDQRDKKLMTVKKKNDKINLNAATSFFGDLATIASGAGAKYFKWFQAMSIAQATISGFEAASHAWTKGMGIGGLPVAALFTAVSVAKTGVQIAGIASQKPAKLEFGGIIPASAQGSIIAGEKNKAEAIIPLEGEGADRLAASGFGGGMTVNINMSGAVLAGDEIPEKIVEGIDRGLFKLGLNKNSLVMQGA